MGACLQFCRGCLSGAEIAPFRLWLPPPASRSLAGDGPLHSQLALLWNSFSPLFCVWVMQCLRLGLFTGSFSLSFLSLAIPQIGLLSHVSSLRLPSGHSDLVLPLSNTAHTSCSAPRLLEANMSVWTTSLLEVDVRYVICGNCLFIYFSSRLCCALRFQNSPLTCQWECSLVFGNFSSMKTPFWDRSPSRPLLSLFLSFIFCLTSFWRKWAAFLGAWCPLPAFRICFVEFAQRSNVLSMNLWGRKWSAHPIPLPS